MSKGKRISPSSLAATEHCPRFRPGDFEGQAAIDGTMYHEKMEEMVLTVPRDQWEGWVATRAVSPALLGLFEQTVATLKTVVTEDLPVFGGFRLRMRGGKPRKTRLKPGLYPECELERGGGSHGYIDLLVVTQEGLVYIVDYKSSRVAKDFSWQLGAYAVDVNAICPTHTGFVCMIIAPRLDDDDQLRMELGEPELAMLRAWISTIEQKADDSLWDEGIPSCPGDHCEFCKGSAKCRALACATVAMVSPATEDVTLVSAKGKETLVRSLQSLVGPDGPYHGQTITSQTFTNPGTVEQRGLRRACLKFIEVLVERAKEDDRTWTKQWGEDQLKDLVPGYVVSWRNGHGTVDGTRMGEIRSKIMSEFGLSMEDVFAVSDVSKDKLADLLVQQGVKKTKTAADTAVKKLYEPYTTPGAPSLYWTQKPVSTRTAVDREL